MQRQIPDGQAVRDWTQFIGCGPDWPRPVQAKLMAMIADPSRLKDAVAQAVATMHAALA